MTVRATRRELIVGAAAAAMSGSVAADEAVADAPAPSDADLLGQSLQVERLIVLGYRRVFDSGLLAPTIRQAIAPHLDHELAHLAALAARLKSLGAPAPIGPLDDKAAGDVMAQHHVPGSLTGLHTQNDCLKLLVDLESAAEGAHYTALKDLRDPSLQHLSAQIMSCEAQHWTVLSGLRNPGQYVKAIPWPFVFGTK